ncbi:MAG: CoA transferase [Burkholderiales bacterium]|nr:CoA transferase [Burkholderiales bacterium]
MRQRPLAGLRVLSLGLNLPAPMAAHGARQLGARVRKLEPPSGDPLALYAPAAYAELHQGIAVRRLDLQLAQGQAQLARELAKADVLLTSFRPQALRRLGLGWRALHAAYPLLWQVAVEGSLQAPDEAGHDLTYQALLGLLSEDLPPNLWADMCGAQQALTALHQVHIGRLRGETPRCLRVGLVDALAQAAAPHRWGLTRPGGLLGGRHAGYQLLPCRDGRVALAALEPKFTLALARCAGLAEPVNWLTPQPALRRWLARHSAAELQALAAEHDLPLVVCP